MDFPRKSPPKSNSDWGPGRGETGSLRLSVAISGEQDRSEFRQRPGSRHISINMPPSFGDTGMCVIYIYIYKHMYIHIVVVFWVTLMKVLWHEGFCSHSVNFIWKRRLVGSDRCQSPLDSWGRFLSPVNNMYVTTQSFHQISARCIVCISLPLSLST